MSAAARGKLAAIAELLAVESALFALADHFTKLAHRNYRWRDQTTRSNEEALNGLPHDLARISAARFESNGDALLIAAQVASRRAEASKKKRRALQRTLDP